MSSEFILPLLLSLLLSLLPHDDKTKTDTLNATSSFTKCVITIPDSVKKASIAKLIDGFEQAYFLSGINLRTFPLIQYRLNEGAGPSLKT